MAEPANDEASQLADAVSFFADMVTPTVTEFLADRENKRLACLACLMLASASDHYFYTPGASLDGHQTANSYRTSHAKANFAVGIVIGIANATKHFRRWKDRPGYDHVVSEEIACGNLQCGWPINGQEVVIEVKPNELWLLSDLVEEAMSYWAAKLQSLVPRHEIQFLTTCPTPTKEPSPCSS